MTTEETARLGILAKQLLENPTFKDVWVYLEAKYAAGWLNSRAEDTDRREHLWRLRKNMADLRDEIAALVNDGKMAAAEIEAREKAERFNQANRIPQ